MPRSSHPSLGLTFDCFVSFFVDRAPGRGESAGSVPAGASTWRPPPHLLLCPQSVGAGETDSLDGLTSRCATRAEARRTHPNRTTTGSTPRQRPPLLLPPASTRPSRRGAGRTSRAQLRRGGGASRAPRLTERTADPTRRRRPWKRVPQLAPHRPPSHRRRAPARRPAQAARAAPRRAPRRSTR